MANTSIKNLTKSRKTILTIIVILAVLLIGFMMKQNWLGATRYYAVYLRTGDLYFGQLSYFPHFTLRNVYTLQVNAQNQENPVSIQRFKDVFWGPMDYLKLNRDQVVWVAKLDSAGQLSEIIRTNPGLVAPQAQSAQ